MKVIKIILTATLITLLAIININAYASPMVKHITSPMMPTNTNLEININGVKYNVHVPQNVASTPVTIKIMDDSEIIFEHTIINNTRVTNDGADFRVVSDGIDHRITSDSVEFHQDGDYILEVLQNGIIIFSKEI